MLNLEQIFFPKTLKEAVAMLTDLGEEACPVAGGTSLMHRPPSGIKFLVDLSQLGLNHIRLEGSEVVVGSTVSIAELGSDLRVLTIASGLLGMACRQGWPRSIVQTATIGGNIAKGNPYADGPTALLALKAQLVFIDESGVHQVPMHHFFQGYRKTVADAGIIQEIRLPVRPDLHGIFLKVSAEQEGEPLINMALVFEQVEGRIRDVRLAVAGVTPFPCRLYPVEEVLENASLDSGLPEKVATLTQEWVDPSVDIRVSVDDQRRIAGQLAKKAFEFLVKRAS